MANHSLAITWLQKHGVVGLCRSLANELGEYNIRVNSIHPGPCDTEMAKDPDIFVLIDRYRETLGPLFGNTLPFSLIQPEDVAGLVAFLCSEEAKFMTGGQIPIDLGASNR